MVELVLMERVGLADEKSTLPPSKSGPSIVTELVALPVMLGGVVVWPGNGLGVGQLGLPVMFAPAIMLML